MSYTEGQPHRKWFVKKLLLGILIIVLALALAGLLAYRQYNEALKPVSGDQTEKVVVIEPGSGVKDISLNLEQNGLIRKASAFEWYVRLERVGDLKAGTYRLRPNMGVAEIVGVLQAGKEATNLVTILPGKRISEIKAALQEAGFSETDVDAALNPDSYAGHPALADSPGLASLEGYLYPESFQKTGSTTAATVITASLDEMNKALTSQVRAGIKAQGLSVHEGIILASLIENEISDHGNEQSLTEKRQVAQVFLTRLKHDIRLESNATDDYPDDFNTYQITGLPPAPLTNVSRRSLEAVADPANTDFVYFVTGADCETRFSTKLSAHEALVSQHGLSTQSEECQ